MGEFTLRERGLLTRPKLHSQREFAVFKPFTIDGRNIRVPLDEIEYQVIKCGPHLVDHFSGKNRNLKGRAVGDRKFFCFFALRLGQPMRVTGSVQGNASLDSLEVFSSPSELAFRGFDAADHHAGS